MATCPSCAVSSRTDAEAIEVTRILVAKPIGTFSVSGSTMKTVAYERYQMRCTRCGWHIDGTLTDDEFLGDPSTEVLPPVSPPGSREPQRANPDS